MEQLQTVFDRIRHHNMTESYNLRLQYSCTVLKVHQMVSNLRHLNFMQSEVPGWFISRSFMFKFLTMTKFLNAVGKDFDVSISGMSCVLNVKHLTAMALPVSDEVYEKNLRINGTRCNK